MSEKTPSSDHRAVSRLRQNLGYVGAELRRHLPFSVFSVAAGIVVLGMLTAVIQSVGGDLGRPYEVPAVHAEQEHGDDHGHDHSVFATPAGGLFHVFHPVHLLLSAVATTAMFWRYERRLWKAVVTGFVGSVVVCSLSDIFFPYIGGLLLGAPMGFHVCVIDHPGLVLPFVFVGIGVGILAADAVKASTVVSHSGHVFTSSMASILYLVTYGLSGWTEHIGGVFLVVVVAVMVPCCVSDIIFPLLVVTPEGAPRPHAHEH
ncbi:MAG: hypothetical protein KAX80_00985 [Planctomycetes bacterium]|nr:hypothetical protein [Planctomycetota bacterium]